MSDEPVDHRPRCSYCRKLVPTAEQRGVQRLKKSNHDATGELCLCDDKWPGQTPPEPPKTPTPVKG